MLCVARLWAPMQGLAHTFREQTQVLLTSLCSGSHQWGIWPLISPGPWEQGVRKLAAIGSFRSWGKAEDLCSVW